MAASPNAPHNAHESALSRALGRTRWVVLLAVVSVIFVSLSLFLLGVVQVGFGLWHAGQSVLQSFSTGDSKPLSTLSVDFLEIVSTLLKAVVFYLIGVGLYSLFIAPLSVAVALGVQTLADLDEMIVNIIIVILAVTFLEHFIRWEKPQEILQFGVSMALVIAALVAFQAVSHRTKKNEEDPDPNVTARARHEMFQQDDETHETSDPGVERAEG